MGPSGHPVRRRVDASAAVAEKATEKLVKEFNHIRCQATEPLSTFLDYITYAPRPNRWTPAAYAPQLWLHD